MYQVSLNELYSKRYSIELGGISWEKLPYNQMASAKYEMLNQIYPMDLYEN